MTTRFGMGAVAVVLLLLLAGTAAGQAIVDVQWDGDDAHGWFAAVSLGGNAACDSLYCAAVAPSGNASGSGLALAEGDARSGLASASLSGHSESNFPVSVFGTCADRHLDTRPRACFAVSPEGDADGFYLAASGTGSATCVGRLCVAAVSAAGGDARCWGDYCVVAAGPLGHADCEWGFTWCVAASGTGPATGKGVAASGTGPADGRGGYAVSGTGDVACGRDCVTVGGNATCGHSCQATTVFGDASCDARYVYPARYCYAVTVFGDAECASRSRCYAVTVFGEARSDAPESYAIEVLP